MIYYFYLLFDCQIFIISTFFYTKHKLATCKEYVFSVIKKEIALLEQSLFVLGKILDYFSDFLRLCSCISRESSRPVCPATEVFSCARRIK